MRSEEKCEKSQKSQYCPNGQLQTKIVRKIEKQVTNSVKKFKRIEKLSKLHRIWRYNKI
jgi:hypothetical protein